jgi:hypothetical protein
MNPKDWRAAFDYLILPSSVVQPAPISDSPDLLINGLDDEAVVAWAVKHNSPTDKDVVSWENIQVEIYKAEPLLDVKNVCLVISALNLCEEVQNVLDRCKSGSMLLGSGEWKLSPQSWTLSTVAGVLKLKIQPKMQVLLLGSVALRSFIGHQSMRALHLLCDEQRRKYASLYVAALQPPPSCLVSQLCNDP